MQVEKPVSMPLSGLTLHSTGGVGICALILVVLFSACYASHLSGLQISLPWLDVLASEVMSYLWEDRFLDAVSKLLASKSV